MRPSGDHLGLSAHGDSGTIRTHRSCGAPSAGAIAIRPIPGSATISGTKASHRPFGENLPCQKLIPGTERSTRSGLSAALVDGHNHIGVLRLSKTAAVTIARLSGVQPVGER